LRLFSVTLFATAAIASVTSAQPAASPAADDAKCLLDMVALSNASAPEAQHAGQAGVAFFVGRISAHDPAFDFARLKAMGQNMNAQTAETDLQQKCGPMMQRYLQQLQTALSPPAPPASAPPAAH
jgi:phosphate-selective porin